MERVQWWLQARWLQDVPALAIFVGNPAKLVRYRKGVSEQILQNLGTGETIVAEVPELRLLKGQF